jgi:hypothetical protein
LEEPIEDRYREASRRMISRISDWTTHLRRTFADANA